MAMHSSVNGFLGFDGGCIPRGQCLVIGQSKTNGSFFLHQIMSAALKEKRSVCLASFIQKFHHYNTISQKIGNSLQSAMEAKQFRFFDGLEELAQMLYPEESKQACATNPLILLKEKIQQSLSYLKEQSSNDVVLVIDELSVLISMGLSVCDICTFIYELQESVLGLDSSFSQQINTSDSVVILSSYDKEDRDTLNLCRFLANLSTVDVNVTGLRTGYCKDVHGQACVTWRNDSDASRKHSSTSKTLQFKLVDNSVDFFAAGTSSAVL